MFRYLLLLLLCLGCLAPLMPAYAEDNDDSGIDDQHVYHVYADVDLISMNKIQYAKPKIIVKMVYPRLSSDSGSESIDAFNDLVEKTVREEVNLFKKQVADTHEYQKNIPNSELKNNLSIDFDSSIVNTNNNPLISIRMVIQGYITGMAHPYRRHRVLNFDLDNGNAIELADIFKPDSDYLQILSDYTTKILEKKLKNNQMIAEGAAPKPENFKNWNVSPNGFRITFDEAQVAPYVYGTQTVMIPYSALQDIINPDSAVGQCLMHRKRCLRNNLLTGGFIDEAINSRHRSLNPVSG